MSGDAEIRSLHIEIDALAGDFISGSTGGGLVGFLQAEVHDVTVTFHPAALNGGRHLVTASTFGGLAGRVQGGSIIDSQASGEFITQNVGTEYRGGLAGQVTMGSTITGSSADVYLSTAQVTALGGLIGTCDLSTISDSSSTVTLHRVLGGASYAGGLVGLSHCAIYSSSASGFVEGETGGGLVGLSTSLIEDSHASVTVQGPAGTVSGGLVGRLQNWNQGGGSTQPYPTDLAYATIARSYADGNVNSGLAGGLVGQIVAARVVESYASGEVRGVSRAGGLAAEAVVGTQSLPANLYFIQDSYANNPVLQASGSSGRAGGLLASGQRVRRSYALNEPSCNSIDCSHPLIGIHTQSAVSIDDSYWFYPPNPESSGPPGVGVEASAMGDQSTYSGFQFGASSPWRMEDRPRLQWEP